MMDYSQRLERALSTSLSAHSDQRLPQKWIDFSRTYKTCVFSRLRRQMHCDGTYKEPLKLDHFDGMHYSDRWAVINHLIKSKVLKEMGPLPATLYTGEPGDTSRLLAQMGFGVAEAHMYGGAPGGGKSRFAEIYDQIHRPTLMKDLPLQKLHGEWRGPLHAAPNGGKRMLRSAYTQLKKYWLRATGQMQEISDMNDGHLSNTLALLQESHGNLIARSTFLLGKMHMHFQNQPHIQQVLEDACKFMEQVEVDDLYPIWKELAKEKAIRMQKPDEGINLNLWADDDLNVVD